MSKIPFSHIIPLGFFCSPTEWLIQLGLRQYTYPFDWVICSMDAVNHLIENHFTDLFHLPDLRCEIQDHCIVTHQSYLFQSFHDFSKSWPLDRQLPKVKAKYAHRISDFYRTLKSEQRILFLRYVAPNTSDEAPEIVRFHRIIRPINPLAKCVLVKNADTPLGPIQSEDFILKVISVNKDPNDVVARQLPVELKHYIIQELEYV